MPVSSSIARRRDAASALAVKRFWPFIALGLGAYVAFALVTLPAAIVTSPLTRFGIIAAGVSGTAWNGRAQIVQTAGANLGAVTWQLHPLALFTGRVSADIDLTRRDGFAKAALSVAFSGRTRFQDLNASLPLATLPRGIVPGGWTGTLNLRVADLTLEHGWPTNVAGTVEVVDLTRPARQPVNVGSYKILFPAPNVTPQQGLLVGALTESGGPLQINGQVQLKSDRSYLIEGQIAARPGAPSEVVEGLKYLGTPDAQGRRPFSLSGTF